MSDFACDMGEWKNFFREAKSRSMDLTPVHEKIGEYLEPHVRDNFITRGGSTTWPDLSPATLTPERLRYGTRPLIKTGVLMATITHLATRFYVDVGSRAKRAPTLFFGSWEKRIPARNPFKFLNGVLDRVGDFYVSHIFGVH